MKLLFRGNWVLRKLIKLLESPLATRVPLPPSTCPSVHQLYPDLFVQQSTASAPLLAPTLVKALQTPWPAGSPTELLYTPFWATVGYGLPEVIDRELGLTVSESRCVATARALCREGAPPCLRNCSILQGQRRCQHYHS